MKYFIKANDVELGTATYICETAEQMRDQWNALGDDVTLVYTSNNGSKTIIFERCW